MRILEFPASCVDVALPLGLAAVIAVSSLPAPREILLVCRRRGRRSWARAAGAGPRGVTSATFYSRFRKYLLAAGLAPTGLHILRHTAAKLRRDAGASIEAVSSFLDHSSLAVTSVYLRRLEGETDRTWPDVAVAIGV